MDVFKEISMAYCYICVIIPQGLVCSSLLVNISIISDWKTSKMIIIFILHQVGKDLQNADDLFRI